MDVSPILLHDQFYSLPASRHTKQKITRSLCSSPFSPSFSTGSSTPSSCEYGSPLSPNSPLKFRGVPFKWEEQPGIPKRSPPLPKNQLIKQSPWDPLPLPPTGPPPRSMSSFMWKKSKLHGHAKLGRDPFMAALVACSRPDEHNRKGSSRVTRAFSGRLGSCKSVSCVVESTVLIPRSSRTKYEMLNGRMG